MDGLLINISEDQFTLFFSSLHVYVCTCTCSVHNQMFMLKGLRSTWVSTLFWDTVYPWSWRSLWHFAVCFQHWGHRCILQLLPFSCAYWGSKFGSLCLHNEHSTTQPSSQALRIRYMSKISKILNVCSFLKWFPVLWIIFIVI